MRNQRNPNICVSGVLLIKASGHRCHQRGSMTGPSSLQHTFNNYASSYIIGYVYMAPFANGCCCSSIPGFYNVLHNSGMLLDISLLFGINHQWHNKLVEFLQNCKPAKCHKANNNKNHCSFWCFNIQKRIWVRLALFDIDQVFQPQPVTTSQHCTKTKLLWCADGNGWQKVKIVNCQTDQWCNMKSEVKGKWHFFKSDQISSKKPKRPINGANHKFQRKHHWKQIVVFSIVDVLRFGQMGNYANRVVYHRQHRAEIGEKL